MSAVLVWFRTDLRLHDHPALAHAIAHAGRTGAAVVPVWCLDPRTLGTSPFGFPRLGVHRAQFLLEALGDLRAQLRALGSDLVVVRGAPETVLPALSTATGTTHCLFHEEATPEERETEMRVSRALTDAGVRTESVWAHTLVHPGDLPFALDALPDVFTRFRTALEEPRASPPRFRAASAPRAALPAPDTLPPLPTAMDPGSLPTLAELGHEAPPIRDARALLHITGGERAALARVQAWTFDRDRLARYKRTRDGLLHPDDGSRWSPWLALGCLSPRTAYEAITRYEHERGGATEDTYWLTFELLWRDYFRFVARRAGGRLFRASGLTGIAVPWRDPRRDAQAADDLARWTSGTTGFPLVDAAMRELTATGYTSNRARQNVASFLTKNLGIDWRAGAEWFEAQLIDYDPASNWGNWAYAAGVGNDARGFRFFNLHKQAAMYDPDGDFVRHWLGERGPDYPRPMVDLFASATVQERAWRRAWQRAPVNAPVTPPVSPPRAP
ncbi:MAG: DASH family cryptochrome [Gemmatimonadetes bacterium]|nr:DASH family cryptochrome [Gemmatimonadota bacterium]